MKKILKSIADILEVFLISLVIVLILVKLIIMPVEVVGKSMEPTLYEGQRGFSSITSRKNNLERFDIVVVDNGEKLIVKRLIGLPNETIEYKDNVLYIDGVSYNEDYLEDTITEDFIKELKDDEYFVMGDNREISKDSRIVGSFTSDQIKACNIFIIYPFKDFGVK